MGYEGKIRVNKSYEDIGISDRLYIAELAFQLFKHIKTRSYNDCYDTIVRKVINERDILPTCEHKHTCCRPHHH
jgi:hypothetical protein